MKASSTTTDWFDFTEKPVNSLDALTILQHPVPRRFVFQRDPALRFLDEHPEASLFEPIVLPDPVRVLPYSYTGPSAFTLTPQAERALIPSGVPMKGFLGRTLPRYTPPKPNLLSAVLADLAARERHLCDLAAAIDRTLTLLATIDAQVDAATSAAERRMLEARAKRELDAVHAGREEQRVLTKQAKDIRWKLAHLDSPVILADPCDLWTDDTEVALPFGERSFYS